MAGGIGRRKVPVKAPSPAIMAAVEYLLGKAPEHWRLDPVVEYAMIEVEIVKWPALAPRLGPVLADFLGYWMVTRTRGRPLSTSGWRQAWRNWCRIERERAERVALDGSGSRVPGSASRLGTQNAKPATPPVVSEADARAQIAAVKARLGWAAAGTGTGTGTEGEG